MSTQYSGAFQQLYCDATIFENFSHWHPVDFNRVLPFQAADPVFDDAGLLAAEAAHLADPGAASRLAVLEAFAQCGLLSAEDLANLKFIMDEGDSDFFELMGEIYANAGQFICALRWYRECLAVVEAQNPSVRSDRADVFASIGYCLYSLGLFAEAIAWTRSCAGPDLLELTISRVLTDYQAQCCGGRLLAMERSANRTRLTSSTAQGEDLTRQASLQLQSALKQHAPFEEFYFSWVNATAPAPPMPAEGYPFSLELDNSSLPRHKMNLLFALCGRADELSGRGFSGEAKRLLQEAVLLEPQADFVPEKLRELS
jgi:tetratricopeptide (TPR) repeat protein